ncbi:MAG: GNAT family N-acetyltransferase [Ruminococcus sp.]|nr:GNAT family N-acetyltransferase [Ruminococcus sp.]
MENILNLDNHDERIKYYEIVLYNDENKPFKEFPLPDGYKFVFYQDGDRDKWIEIEKSAKEFKTYEDGLKSWNKYYDGKENELYNRMFFVETKDGEKVATATAYYEPKDTSGAGWLHWVAVKRDHQGKGLARPLISHTLNQLRKLGYTTIKIPTQTTTWVAAKLYLDFGFKPIPKNAVNSYDGYRILKTLTNHPTLKDFPSAEPEKILNHK